MQVLGISSKTIRGGALVDVLSLENASLALERRFVRVSACSDFQDVSCSRCLEREGGKGYNGKCERVCYSVEG